MQVRDGEMLVACPAVHTCHHDMSLLAASNFGQCKLVGINAQYIPEPGQKYTCENPLAVHEEADWSTSGRILWFRDCAHARPTPTRGNLCGVKHMVEQRNQGLGKIRSNRLEHRAMYNICRSFVELKSSQGLIDLILVYLLEC
eukprot:6489570-Amphidinium_carterae.3